MTHRPRQLLPMMSPTRQTWVVWARGWHQIPQLLRREPRRRYSVRVPADAPSSVTTVADLRAWQPEADVPDVEVSGWVRSVRKSSAVRFVDISDGSSMRPLQAVVDKAQPRSGDLRPGTAVRLKGSWQSVKPSSAPSLAPAGDRIDGIGHADADGNHKTTRELQVSHIEILASSDAHTYPIQNKYQTPESLRTMPHLRLRTPLNSTFVRMRSDLMAVMNRFFSEQKFQQTHPPILTSSDCEGAGEAFAVEAGETVNFFRDPKYLSVSTQLHLEALAQAVDRVWSLSPTFRAEKSDTSRHLSEFYMLEAEMNVSRGMDEVMDLLQEMLVSVAHGLRERKAANELVRNRLNSREPAERLAFADLVDRRELRKRWRGLLGSKKWPRITYSEAIERLRPVASRFEHKASWGGGLQSEHERYLAEQVGYDESDDAYSPVFVTHFPREIKAFYMRRSHKTGSKETVECFDLLVPGLGELAGGSMREHRLDELVENMRFHGMAVPDGGKLVGNDLGWYLDLRRWGCPPHGGFGLGFDRLLSYLTGVSNVRDVVQFPRHFGRCDC